MALLKVPNLNILRHMKELFSVLIAIIIKKTEQLITALIAMFVSKTTIIIVFSLANVLAVEIFAASGPQSLWYSDYLLVLEHLLYLMQF